MDEAGGRTDHPRAARSGRDSRHTQPSRIVVTWRVPGLAWGKDEAARFPIASRRRGSLAACGASAADGDTGDRLRLDRPDAR